MIPVRYFVARCRYALMVLSLLTSIITVAPAQPETRDTLIRDYYSVLTTYACYAPSLWKDATPGGYWGDGIQAKDQNGGVRGTANTLYGYAMIVYGLDNDLISRSDRRKLRRAGLTRERLIDDIRKNLLYLSIHHVSSPEPMTPQWGYHWQSSLWVGSAGAGALLVWNDLGDGLKQNLIRMVAAEADWVAGRKPKNGTPYDTGAEENAWDTHAPATALAMCPDATSATLWWSALTGRAANVYSRPADLARAQTVNRGPASEVITTNIMDDYSLINHGFFHPDYIQVSAQHLGEAWAILKLGDAVHGTGLAPDFEPYARFNVKETWDLIMKPLLLPTGEFLFPAGTDWTLHCSTTQGYLAYMATAFGDADAAEAEQRALTHVFARREAGPPGRLLGDSNLEWWWEPLVIKRSSCAILFHELDFSQPAKARAAAADLLTLDDMTTTVRLDGAKVWWHRNPQYAAAISWGKSPLGYFMPLGPDVENNPYMTIPSKFGILPRGTTLTLETAAVSSPGVSGMVLRDNDVAIAGLACMPGSAVWISLRGFGCLPVENDSLTLPGRLVESTDGENHLFKALTPAKPRHIDGGWLTIDGYLALITDGDGFDYRPAGHWNMKSVAIDQVTPSDNARAWQMSVGDAAQAESLRAALKVDDTGTSSISVTVNDSFDGGTYRLKLNASGLEIHQLKMAGEPAE